MSASLQTVGYLIAAILFILALGGLSNPRTARAGNLSGIVGMLVALAVTFGAHTEMAHLWAGGAVVVGAIVGTFAAARVAMTSMPQMVAIFNSFVGLAAVLVGFATLLGGGHEVTGMLLGEIYVDVTIGAVTFTGSIVAWGKLAGHFRSAPLLVPGRHLINAGILVALVGIAIPYVGLADPIGPDALYYLSTNAGLAGLLGVSLVVAIGGADMPVVVSLLNSYSGWAAAAAGFMLGNDLLIVTGALVGSSGAILSYIMCEGMNRSIWNVVLGGWGTEATADEEDRGREDVDSAGPRQVADRLQSAQRIGIVPGYGMAVAQAQHAVSELTSLLRRADKEVFFGIHPVAGRMPGHMNVLLAEADVPYDLVDDLEEANDKFPDTDVVLVVGANDTVNPSAVDDKSSPIYGMPQLHVWEADTVFVLKRSLSAGYAGVPNPLFYRENTRMFFGDAAEQLDALLEAL
jgi:NAD(P) transhydrogenase subunit beta